jgi:signal transduction histidine kinase
MPALAVMCSTWEVLPRAANSLAADGQSTHRQLLPASTWMTVLVGVSCLLVAITRSFSSLTWATVVLMITPVALLILQLLIGRQYGDRPPAALAAGAVVAQLGLIELVSQLDGQSIASMLYLTLPFPAVFWLGARAGLVVSAVVLTLFTVRFAVAKPQWRTDPDQQHSYLLFAIAVVLVTAIAQLVRRERTSRERAERLLRDLGASHRQLVESQGRVAELATIEERNRLARDIHDSLGHYLTVISVQLEKAQLLVAEDPVAVSAAVANAKRLADQALADVRQSVGALRRDEAPFLLEPTLRGMVADLRVLPLDLSLRITGNEQQYSRQQLLALYRAVQEGLTNVQRHARASQARVVVELTEAAASVTVDDDGVGPPDGPGVGLRGVRERLELVSGRLVLTTAPGGGTRMSVTIPRTQTRKV